jgi:hypothetical protein
MSQLKKTNATEDIFKSTNPNQYQGKSEAPILNQINKGSFIKASPELKKGITTVEIEGSDLYQELKSAHDKEYDNNLKLTKVMNGLNSFVLLAI